MGYNPNAYTDVNFLNSRSLNNASAAAANWPQPLTAPRFESRDESFMDRFDLATRESMVNRIARDPGREMSTIDPGGELNRRPRPSSPPAPTPTPTPAPMARAAFLLGNFFDKGRLVWPSVAPITGGLGKKQEIADRAILAVLNEHELQGLAQLSSVTEARRLLLDYGRPALEYVRKQTTPAMSDTFHTFLLSLYAQVGLAATVPRTP